jgi:hypothetical protein
MCDDMISSSHTTQGDACQTENLSQTKSSVALPSILFIYPASRKSEMISPADFKSSTGQPPWNHN